MTRIYATPQGELETEDVTMAELKVGDRFVQEGVYSVDRGVHNAVYEVTDDCASNKRGWLFTRDINIDPTAIRSDGTPECEGFFCYPVTTTMHRVTTT